MPKLLTYKEVDAFILRKKKSFCSWCGGAEWGIHTVQPGAINPQFPGVPGTPELRALFPIRLREENGKMDARLAMGTEQALPMIVVECMECGKTDQFNYFAVTRLIEEAKQKDAPSKGGEETNGNDSPN